MRTRTLVLVLVGAVLSGCAWFRDPPEQNVTTGATVVYSGSQGTDVFSICDKGNLVYLTRKNPQVAVLKDGCNPGAPGGQSAAAVAAVTDRTPSPPFSIPQPFLVQLMPGSIPIPPVAATLPAEPREPLILRIEPSSVSVPACPACPAFQFAPPAPPAPLAVPRAAAPKAKALVVSQVDPNTASAEDLERLPGVTAKAAQSIIRSRPYRSLPELVQKRALTEAELSALAPYLVIR